MEYGPDTEFRSREQPTAADYARAAADSADKHATKNDDQLQRLTHLMIEKGVISPGEALWVAVGGNRQMGLPGRRREY